MLPKGESLVCDVINVPRSQNYPDHIFPREIMYSQFAPNQPRIRPGADWK